MNPVVTFPGEGTILFGDKTAGLLLCPIGLTSVNLPGYREGNPKISRTTLFEFNDDITRRLLRTTWILPEMSK